MTRSALDRLDADDAAVCAVVLELHPARDFGEDRVVLAEPGVQPGPGPPAALPHDDRAAGDDVAVVSLDPEALRVGLAAIPGAALTFFVSHCCRPYRRMSLMRSRV